MNIAHLIVARLLNEEHFDAHQHPELYQPTGQDDGKGHQIVRVCAYCEKEYGADKIYPPDIGPSHGYCRRHLIQMYVRDLGFTPEQAASKIGHGDTPPDWQEALGIREALDPSDLYRKSIKNTPLEARLKLSQVANSLAKHGYIGSIRIDPDRGVGHTVLLKLANVPRKDSVNALAQNVRDAFQLGGIRINRYVSDKWKPYLHDQDWGTVSAYVWLWALLSIPEEGLTMDIASLGEPAGAAGGAPPKATFWATAGGGY